MVGGVVEGLFVVVVGGEEVERLDAWEGEGGVHVVVCVLCMCFGFVVLVLVLLCFGLFDLVSFVFDGFGFVCWFLLFEKQCQMRILI